MTAAPAVLGREHWTHKGPVRLFLWEKAAGASPGPLGTILFVHGSARNPLNEYVFPEDIYNRRKMEKIFALIEHYCFQGHTHVPGVFVHDGERVTASPLPADEPLALRPTDRYIINAGSVGQPRDGDPRAAYLWLDEEAAVATLVRLPYPVEKTQEKMVAAGLPAILVERLAYGR